MREIKFRGKRLDNNEWVYGYYAYHEDFFRHRETHGIYSDYADSMPEREGYSFYPDFYAVNPETVGQFTGLYDKNGKEIYEGDVIGGNKINHLIRYKSNRAQFTATLTEYVSDFTENFWECKCEQSWINEFGKEVIGNIHDNPELLKGGEE